jgi:hypothetical protein
MTAVGAEIYASGPVRYRLVVHCDKCEYQCDNEITGDRRGYDEKPLP